VKDICVFLNGDRGLDVLAALSESVHGITCVVVPVSASRDGVAQEIQEKYGLSVMRVENINESSFLQQLTNLRPCLLICAGYSTIFKSELLQLAQLGTINLHAGRLPQYRGGSPLNWQIINGEPSAGLSVIRMDEGIDTGEILGEITLEIRPSETIATLHHRTNPAFGQLVLQVLDHMDAGTLAPRQQGEKGARYWHQRNDGDGCIDWFRMTAAQVHDFVRALSAPYPGAWTRSGDRYVRITATEIPALRISGTPGRVCYIQGEGPYVVCADYAVLVREHHFGDKHSDIDASVYDRDKTLTHGTVLG